MANTSTSRRQLTNLSEPQQIRELNRQLEWIWHKLLGGLNEKSYSKQGLKETVKRIEDTVSASFVIDSGTISQIADAVTNYFVSQIGTTGQSLGQNTAIQNSILRFVLFLLPLANIGWDHIQSLVNVIDTRASQRAQEDAPVQDVQVNSVSVLQDGVANVPIASNNAIGVVKPGSGLAISSEGSMRVEYAGSATIKTATNQYLPVTPKYQHESTFYGLAKAAGDATQSASSNAVGAYTDEAKTAIRRMLGIPNFDGELIADVTSTEDLQTFTVNTDANEQPFVLRVAKCYVVIPASLTGTNDYISAKFSSIKLDGTANSVTSLSTHRMANANKSLNTYEVEAYGAFYLSRDYVASSFGSSSNSMACLNLDKEIAGITGFTVQQYSTSTTLIPAGTRMLIYGVRA